ncbi:MAG: class I SAM-dependent methyltransferase [Erysipelotrichaceae bacterium]|nr:class I SAM-dependent methyltransferase [Erysipelotrichaceae bacterium]
MLSNRLLQIAMLVERNKVVFDVGSDHALLPCFLLENGICDKVYAGEIAQGPLNNVKEAVKRRHLEGRLIPVFSDGLAKAPDDVDIVIISGMGYHTIRHILENCEIGRYQYFLVQSNTDVDLLRKYISESGYTIEDERVVFDGFYYQVIRFSADLHDPYTDLQIKYGPVLLKRRDEVFIAYLKDQLEKMKRINEIANKPEFDEKISEIEKILYNKSL